MCKLHVRYVRYVRCARYVRYVRCVRCVRCVRYVRYVRHRVSCETWRTMSPELHPIPPFIFSKQPL